MTHLRTSATTRTRSIACILLASAAIHCGGHGGTTPPGGSGGPEVLRRDCSRGHAESCLALPDLVEKMSREDATPHVTTLHGVCSQGLAAGCLAAAAVCANREDTDCALEFMVRGCVLGESKICELVDSLASKCDAEADCKKITTKILESPDLSSSPMLVHALFDGMDRLCHVHRNGGACYGAALVFQNNTPRELDKELEHMSLACEYGHADGCKDSLTLLEARCRERGDADACCRAGQLLLTGDAGSERDVRQGNEYIREARGLGGQCNRTPPARRTSPAA